MEKTLDLYITKMCNLNCEYCYVDIGYDSQDFSSGVFLERKNLLEYDHIKFFGGEPLLKWKEIQEIIIAIHNRKRKTKFTIVSNGLLINQEKCDFLKKYNVSLVISVHGFPGASKLVTQATIILNTLNPLKYDFLFVLNRKSYPAILRDLKILVGLGIKNFNITPDSSVLWRDTEYIFLEKALNFVKKIALRYQEITLTFSDSSKLISDKISCKKSIFYGKEYKVCNRFTKLDYFRKDFFKELQFVLQQEGFYENPYRYFFSCPIGYFLDHIEKKIPFSLIAQSYIKVNMAFIMIQQEIEIHKNKSTFLTIIPETLRFNLTNQCNLRCRYCYVDFDNSEISPSEILRIVQYFLERKRTPKIISFFGGEPLLSYKNLEKTLPEIIKLYQFFGQNFPKFQIATNALLLNEEKLKLLTDYNFEIHISIGGAQKNHNLLRDNSYDKFYDIEEKYSLFTGENITFLLMIDEGSVKSLLKEYILLTQQGVTKIHLECVFKKDPWSDNSISVLSKQMELIYLYDGGKYLRKSIGNMIYDVSTGGAIAKESLSFHGDYNFDAKKVLDKIIL